MIGNRAPHLNHDAMPLAEAVVEAVEVDGILLDLVGRDRHRRLEATPASFATAAWRDAGSLLDSFSNGVDP
jgi:hypothetical protein